ncbi:hypothetical protein ACFLU5_16760 [Bacteroidota bacterium]
MDRRHFLKSKATLTMAISGYTFFPDLLFGASGGKNKKSYIEYVRKSSLTKEVIDVFLEENSWAQFDPEVGYIMGNYMPHDGMDGSSTISTSKNRMRYNQIYNSKPCRINTYGNSFTQCHQVSDGETWQEYLAAHLGEPIRNFGMGGLGTYQAYKRMLREEQSDHEAEYLILYLWGDDYMRSLLRCRYILFYPRWDNFDGYMFHGNFWSNIEMDLTSGKLAEKENILNTPESVYKMMDEDFLVDALKDDLMLQLSLIVRSQVNTDLDVKGLKALADIYDLPEIDFKDEKNTYKTANALRNTYAFDATKYILKKASAFVEKHGKKLMILHLDPYNVLQTLLQKGTRYDQEVVDYLNKNNYLYIDMNEVHVIDFKNFILSFDDYMKRYFIGHYNPSGNHFFAYALKNKVVEWLDPKPITYRKDDSKMVDFNGYLPE